MNPQAAQDFFQSLNRLICEYHESPSHEKALSLIEELSKADQVNRELTGDKKGMQMSIAGTIDGLFDSTLEDFKWNDETASHLLHRSAETRSSYPPDGPGWNDYFMAHWMVSRSEEAMESLARRVQGRGFSPDVRMSARWMVRSVRSEVPDFQEAFELQHTKIYGSMERPPEFTGPVPGYGFMPQGGGMTGFEPYMDALQKWFESMLPSEAKTEAKRGEKQREMDDEDERRIGVGVYLEELANGRTTEEAMDIADRAVYVWRIRWDQRRQAAEPKTAEE